MDTLHSDEAAEPPPGGRADDRAPRVVVRRGVHIRAADGVVLAADVFAPQNGRPELGVLVVNGATAVPRGFYARFATHAAQQGLAVVTYDYRGTGDSTAAPAGSLMRHWGERDFPAVLAWAREAFPGSAAFALGHSVGGQLFGLTETAESLDALIGVAAQSGYWRLSGSRAARLFNWYVMVPALAHAFGYLPAWSGVGADLPKSIALEWARWCRSARFFVDEAGAPLTTHFARIRAPVLWIGIEGDPYGSRAAVAWLADQFTSARLERREYSGARFGTAPIGHFKLFTPRYRAAWDELIAWLRSTR